MNLAREFIWPPVPRSDDISPTFRGQGYVQTFTAEMARKLLRESGGEVLKSL
ncbi:MAG: hypothetical protein ABIR35_10900 [Polaromonas sp.]